MSKRKQSAHVRHAQPQTGQRAATSYEAHAGWAQPLPGARYHYFKRGALRCLCGLWLSSSVPRDDRDALATHPLACRTCREQAQALGTVGKVEAQL